MKAELGPGDAAEGARGRSEDEEARVIVRLMGEGQWRVDDSVSRG